jgi:hypothetical protein
VDRDELGDAGLEPAGLVVEEPDPAGEFTHREPGLCLDRVGVVVGESAGPAKLCRQ